MSDKEEKNLSKNRDYWCLSNDMFEATSTNPIHLDLVVTIMCDGFHTFWTYILENTNDILEAFNIVSWDFIEEHNTKSYTHLFIAQESLYSDVTVSRSTQQKIKITYAKSWNHSWQRRPENTINNFRTQIGRQNSGKRNILPNAWKRMSDNSSEPPTPMFLTINNT